MYTLEDVYKTFPSGCTEDYKILRAFEMGKQSKEKRIEELEKENKRLTDELKALRESIKDYGAGCYENGLRNGKRKLEEQIEKMKCCGNCENGELSAHEEPCLHCQRCFASTDVTDQENVKDYWEAIKEIKEK